MATSSRCRRRVTTALKDFRVLVIDTDPLMPTDKVVRGTIDTLAANLAKAGVKVERNSPLLPNFAESSRLYMRMLMSFLGASFPPEVYAGAQAAAAAVAGERRQSLAAERLRGMAQSHRDWLMDDGARAAAARAMARAVQDLRRRDLPDHADAGLSARSFRRTRRSAASGSTARITSIPTSSPGPASPRCPACPRPRSRPASRRTDCRSACRSSAPGWRTARR